MPFQPMHFQPLPIHPLTLSTFCNFNLQQFQPITLPPNCSQLDGTFNLSPDNFYQIHTIHTELKDFAPPCVYLLPPNKTEKTIPECLNCSAKKQTPNLIASLQILKKAALNAFSKKCPDANISCCYFDVATLEPCP